MTDERPARREPGLETEPPAASADPVPPGLDEHVRHVFGQGDEPPEFYGGRHATDLFEPFGPRSRGLGAGRPAEVVQLLRGRPAKLRFLTAEQLRSVGAAGADTVDRSRDRHRVANRQEDVARRHLYSRVAAGEGTEYGFRRGPDLAVAAGYAPDDLVPVPPSTLERFVGLGNPWLLGRAEAGWRCADIGCGVGVDVFVAAGHVGPRGLAVGVDLAPGMVRAVRDAARAAGTTNVVAIEASATAVPMADRWADLVTANGLLVLMPDVAGVLAEIARLLRPGGRLRFADTVYGTNPLPDPVDDLLYWNRLTHGRPFVDEVVALLSDAGFGDIVVGPQIDPFDPAVDHSDVWGRTFEAVRP